MIETDEIKINIAASNANSEETSPKVNEVQVNGAPPPDPQGSASLKVSDPAYGEMAVVATSTGRPKIEAAPPFGLDKAYQLALSSTNGKGHILISEGTNPFAVPIDSKYTEALIHEAAAKNDKRLSRQAVTDAKYRLQSNAERIGTVKHIWHRVAPVPGGIEVDLGGPAHWRVRVTAGQVNVIKSGSEVEFCRAATMMPMPKPVEAGNHDLLKARVNLKPDAYVLLLAWITYTLATPKTASAKFPILVLQSGEGTGKTALAKLLIQLIDPSRVGVRTFHKNEKDLAIALQSAHVVAYDNLRYVSHEMADLLCIACTGGNISTRQLYTDSEQSLLRLHGAVILNGIPDVVDQPDLAQRTVKLHLEPIAEDARKSDTEIAASLAIDLPAIQRGLFDLIARIFEQLPNAKVSRPARMIDFSKWLAALELVDGAPAEAYQELYRDNLKQGQLDSLLDNVLAAEVLKFAESHMDGPLWSGTPAEFLEELNKWAGLGNQTSRGWPGNPIALSKRLLPLQTALRAQGVLLELHRGKQRTVTLKWADGRQAPPRRDENAAPDDRSMY